MSLDALREKINAVDAKLVPLLCERMALSGEVAAYKQKKGIPVLDEARERAILDKVSAMAAEGCEQPIRSLYASIFDTSRSLQYAQMHSASTLVAEIEKALRNAPEVFPRRGVVACQGIEGAYSQQACQRLFAEPDVLYCRTFKGVFQAVENGLCEFGVLPIENSTHGSVAAVYDLMRRHRFSIVRSAKLHIDHKLLGIPGAERSPIREIISHEQAIGQCSEYLAAHPQIKVTVCENTAVAAKKVAASGRHDVAAIASQACASRYGLTVLESNIQNSQNNYTRFLCITRDLTVYPGANRISLMLKTPHSPGALYHTLARFASLGVNLTKLESRPIPGSDFDFLFYLDLEASVAVPEIRAILGNLSQEDAQFTFLGNYSEV